ncbi:MAG: hypothetical protein BMS9Abin05_0054 [Rhodothermia bacterium]|nr:MAG: hypothetical protein BMS9Abin05_0054 [Rhodothermia bacterium]
MLAFLAMSIAVLVALNQQRSEIRSYESIVDAEYEIMANAVSIEQLEVIAASTIWNNLEVWDDSVITRNFSLPTFQESFDVSVSVQFVDGSGYPSVTPTTVKEVAVSAENNRYTSPIVTHARLISE